MRIYINYSSDECEYYSLPVLAASGAKRNAQQVVRRLKQFIQDTPSCSAD